MWAAAAANDDEQQKSLFFFSMLSMKIRRRVIRESEVFFACVLAFDGFWHFYRPAPKIYTYTCIYNVVVL